MRVWAIVVNLNQREMLSECVGSLEAGLAEVEGVESLGVPAIVAFAPLEREPDLRRLASRPLVKGVRRLGPIIRTESIVLRSRSGTIRRVLADHQASKWLE